MQTIDDSFEQPWHWYLEPFSVLALVVIQQKKPVRCLLTLEWLAALGRVIQLYEKNVIFYEIQWMCKVTKL